jgi:hypothetical protein
MHHPAAVACRCPPACNGVVDQIEIQTEDSNAKRLRNELPPPGREGSLGSHWEKRRGENSMRVLAFRFPVERVEGHDVQETLPRVAALIDVSASSFLALPFRVKARASVSYFVSMPACAVRGTDHAQCNTEDHCRVTKKSATLRPRCPTNGRSGPRRSVRRF